MSRGLGFRFLKNAARFTRSQRGASVVSLAMSLGVLVGAVGLSFDAGRGYLIKDRLSAAVDAAALAGGRSLGVGGGGHGAQATKYFNANMPDGFMGATISAPQIKLLNGGNQLEVFATATVPTTLMKVLKSGDLVISAKAVVARATRGTEVALVLDNSGSMSGGKMDDLRTATQTLLDMMYGAATTVDNLHVSVVPFTGRTNLKGQAAIHPASPPDNDLVCTNVRNGVEGRNDATPAQEALTHYNGLHDPAGGFVQRITYGMLICPGAEILALTQDKTEVETALDAMSPQGCTRYDTGTAWGWRTLSPSWRGLWTDAAGDVMTSMPLDYGTPEMDKAIIVMTDGFITSKSSCGDTTTDADAENNFAQTCSMMKAAGVIVYTIVFDLDDSDTETLFENCASGSKRYFKSPEVATLEEAFAEIARDLTTLRLVN